REPMPHALMHAALNSIAELAIVPMQDVLELGGEHRMNVPGVADGNWHWQFAWEQLQPTAIDWWRAHVAQSGRAARSGEPT
ncbi:MAG: 4-alpha-glucanotransferase, partial [Gammaproteobacteria bacterium]|nr:4-alpha-glucanotransferase [Gammaproteobacteria bacterium]